MNSTIKYFLILFLLITNSRVFSINFCQEKQLKSDYVVKRNGLFTENKGQMLDFNYQPVDFVLFKIESPAIDVFITENGLTYLFKKYEEQHLFTEASGDKNEKIKTDWARVDMLLKGATIKKENIIKEGQSIDFNNNYFSNNVPIKDIYHYKKITIKEIYPGIDWVLYNSNEKGFKYDFIIHPNADPNQIKLIYEGAGKFLAEKNKIVFKNEIGELIEGKLYCYQGNQQKEINSEYLCKVGRQMSDDGGELLEINYLSSIIRHQSSNVFSYEVKIQLSEYDHSKELIIDPQLVWGTFYGGSGLDGPTSLTTDPLGNVYATGYLESTNFPLQNPGGTTYYQGTIASVVKDVFVMKFNNNGVLQWSTYFGGTGEDQGNCICADNNGNVFVTGFTYSNDLPLLNPLGGAYYQATNGFASSQDAFILKFSNTGTLVWSTYYGGFGNDLGNSICTNNNGDVIVVGQAFAANIPTFAPAGAGYYQPAIGSASDAFILKFTNAGVQQWGTYFGGSDIDIGSSVTADNNGNIYVTGSTRSGDLPTVNPGGTTYFLNKVGTNYDAFISKFDANLVLQWSTFYGGTAIDEGKSIVTDNAGNVFVAGQTGSNAFPTLNPGGTTFFQATNGGGNNDAFILKFDNVGARQWATYIGGTGDELFNSEKTLAIDSCENLYLSINTTSTSMSVKQSCAVGHYYDASANGGRDVFLSCFSTNGVQRWGTFFGGNGDDFRQAIATDRNGNLFVGGEWTDENGITPTGGTYPLSNPGSSALYDASFNGGIDDGYIAKFRPTTITLNANSTNAVCICNGTATASASGGCSPYQYLWYDSNWLQVGNGQAINNLCPGTYHVIARDSATCSKPDTATVSITSSGSAVSFTQNVSICNGASYTLPGGNPASTAGTYLDTLQTTLGCDSIIITILSVVNNILVTLNPTICNGSSYMLPNGNPATTAGIYKDTLQSSGGCDSIITINLTVLNSYNNTQSINICAGQSYTLPGGNSANISGTYNDTLNASNGCDSIIITNLNITPSTPFTQNISICKGQSYTLPNGNTTTIAGTYNDTLTTSAGCDSIIITNLTIVPPTPVTQNVSICIGQSFTLPGGNAVSIAGNYNDTISTTAGCDSIVITTLTINQLPTATPGTSLQLSCTTTSGTISVTTSATNPNYSWSGPGIVSGASTSSPTINAAGTYTVIVTDAVTGCTNSTTVTVTNNTPLPNVSGGPSVIIPCNPQSESILATSTTNGVTYSWNGPGIVSGGTTSNPTINVAGTYTVTVFDPSTGCTNTATVTATNATPPSASVSPNTIIFLGSSTTLVAAGGNNYNWFPVTHLNTTTGNTVIASPIQTTTYCVEVTDSNGCKDTACVTVSIEIPCPDVDELAVPNAFSPNADGVNDEFCLQGWTPCNEEFMVVIYNRWGEKVYESKDPNFCWDGYFRGSVLDAQVFVYYIKATFKNSNRTSLKKGNISLVR